MKFKGYHLFYSQAALFIGIAYITRNVKTYSAGWDSKYLTGFWSFLFPGAFCSLLIGFIYHYLSAKNNSIKPGPIIVHFSFMALGMIVLFFNWFYFSFLILYLNRTFVILISISGPIFLICSAVLFLINVVNFSNSKFIKK